MLAFQAAERQAGGGAAGRVYATVSLEQAAAEALAEAEATFTAATRRAAVHWAGHQPEDGPAVLTKAGRCWVCGSSFTFFDRRHHCRDCGQSVCDTHSLQRMRLPNRGAGAELQRVCDR